MILFENDKIVPVSVIFCNRNLSHTSLYDIQKHTPFFRRVLLFTDINSLSSMHGTACSNADKAPVLLHSEMLSCSLCFR